MNYSDYRKRVEQAKSLDHEESREELLTEIRKELSPLIAEMDRAIGRSIRFIEDLDESLYDEEDVCTAENRRHTVHLSETNVTDSYGLYRVKRQIANLQLKEARDTAELLDTDVRERIPNQVWDFFKDRN
jgi:hypothetical protein